VSRGLLTPAAFVRDLTAERLFVGGFTGEPTAVVDALLAMPLRGAGRHLVTVAIPGVNSRDLAATVPDGTVETFFMPPALRPAFEAGRVRLRPLHYHAIDRDFRQRRDVQLAILRTSAPRNGVLSLGLAHDFGPAWIDAGCPVAAMIDPTVPFVPDGMTLPVERCVALIDGAGDAPVAPAVEPQRAELLAIARQAAALVPAGATLQTGIGAAPDAILTALSDRRDLTLFGGMVTDAGLDLLETGAVGRITAGAALVTPGWQARLANEPRVAFRPVAITHDVRRIAAIPRFMAINSALQVDLLGQAQGEMIGSRQVSGQGGSADFVRGARLSEGGRAMLVLSATGDRGRASRIVPALAAGVPAAIGRGDIDLVVTEFGVADVRDTDIDTRAERLIAVAAPNFRAGLTEAWDRLRRAM
jgi:acyl-CoA hydrolase